MKIVQTDEIPLKRGLEHRGGIFHGRIMVEGEPGALDNFQLSFGQMGGDFNSPRHRHNFEQIRYQLEGVLDYGRDGKLTAPAIQRIVDALATNGFIGERYDVAKYIDLSYLPQ